MNKMYVVEATLIARLWLPVSVWSVQRNLHRGWEGTIVKSTCRRKLEKREGINIRRGSKEKRKNLVNVIKLNTFKKGRKKTFIILCFMMFLCLSYIPTIPTNCSFLWIPADINIVLLSLTPLCNRSSGIYILTGLSETTSPVWFIFHWGFFCSCVSPVKANRGGRPYIFTAGMNGLWKRYTYFSSEKN